MLIWQSCPPFLFYFHLLALQKFIKTKIKTYTEECRRNITFENIIINKCLKSKSNISDISPSARNSIQKNQSTRKKHFQNEPVVSNHSEDKPQSKVLSIEVIQVNKDELSVVRAMNSDQLQIRFVVEL